MNNNKSTFNKEYVLIKKEVEELKEEINSTEESFKNYLFYISVAGLYGGVITGSLCVIGYYTGYSMNKSLESSAIATGGFIIVLILHNLLKRFDYYQNIKKLKELEMKLSENKNSLEKDYLNRIVMRKLEKK